MSSLRFENNLLSREGVRFASISKKTLLSKLSFAFVSLALPLLINGTSGKFATGVNDTGGKIAAGINDTSGKFATGVSDTGGKFFHQFR